MVGCVTKKNDETVATQVRVPRELRRELDEIGEKTWPRSYRNTGSGKVGTQILAGALLFTRCTAELRRAAVDAVEHIGESSDSITESLQDAGLPIPQQGATADAATDAGGRGGRGRQRA